MAFVTKDGTKFTNAMAGKKYNLRSDVKPVAKPLETNDTYMDKDNDNDNDMSKDITNDPHAMTLVKELENMGYDESDFAEACQAGKGEDKDSAPKMDNEAAGLQIPGAMMK